MRIHSLAQRSSVEKGFIRPRGGQSHSIGMLPSRISSASQSQAVVMVAGNWVSCRSQQLGKPGPQPVRSIDCVEQSSGNILGGAAGASGAAWHGTLPQRAGTPLLPLLPRLFSVGSSARGRQGRASLCARSLPKLGMVFARLSATPAVAPGAKLDTR